MRATLVPIGKFVMFDKAQFEKVYENSLEQTAKSMLIDYRVTVRTWKNKPQFKIERKPWEREVFTAMTFSKPATPGDIYGYVAEGTRVRYATMTPNFRAKSRIMKIRSLKGRGGVAFIDTNRPRPGIQAREWPTAIGRKWSRQWNRTLTTAVAAEQYWS